MVMMKMKTVTTLVKTVARVKGKAIQEPVAKVMKRVAPLVALAVMVMAKERGATEMAAAAETEALPAGMEALMEVEAKGVVPAAGLAAGTLHRRHEILYCST